MKAYFACLAAYNSGILHGTWVDLEGATEDDVWDAVRDMLRRSPCPNVEVDCPDCEDGVQVHHNPEPGVYLLGLTCKTCRGTGKVPSAEEWAVHDYDDFPNLGEYPDVARMVGIAQALTRTHNPDALRAWLATESDVDGFEDAYLGSGESWESFFEERAEETGLLESVPEDLRRYFDFELYARDMRCNGVWAEEYGGQLHFFDR